MNKLLLILGLGLVMGNLPALPIARSGGTLLQRQND